MGSMMGGGKDYDDEVMPIVVDFLSQNVTSGITTTHVDNSKNDIIYNIQGMRISKPSKGMIYIENGKKRIDLCSKTAE